MQFKEYLEETGMSATDFARWIGVSPSLVSKWLEPDFEKRTIPNKKHMLMIREITGYRVTADSFYPPPPRSSRHRAAAANGEDKRPLFIQYVEAYNEAAREAASSTSVKPAINRSGGKR